MGRGPGTVRYNGIINRTGDGGSLDTGAVLTYIFKACAPPWGFAVSPGPSSSAASGTLSQRRASDIGVTERSIHTPYGHLSSYRRRPAPVPLLTIAPLSASLHATGSVA